MADEGTRTVYTKVARVLVNAVFQAKKPRDLVADLNNLRGELFVFASPQVLAAIHDWFVVAHSNPQGRKGAIDIAHASERVFLITREELGVSNEGLVPGQLLGTFFEDASLGESSSQ